MSSSVPNIQCQPDDADNPADILTAKGGDKIAQLVYKHVDAPLLFCKALFTFCLQGLVAAYNYSVEDTEYGTVGVNKYEDDEVDVQSEVCPECGAPIQPDDIQAMLNEIDQYMPGSSDAPLDAKINKALEDGQTICAACQAQINPKIVTNKIIVERLIGVTQQPKSRQCIEILGGLFVKVPNYARNQKECPYLIYSHEEHFATILGKYPWMREKFDVNKNKLTTNSMSGNDLYERWGRLSTQYFNEYPLNTPTVKKVWLRPCAAHVLRDADKRSEFNQKFPDGCCVIFINDEFCDAYNEKLDDCWTLSWNPLSNYIHFDPIGLLLTSVQEITNDLVSLTLQTIEHGIGQTIADPTVINFEQYRQNEATPGMIIPGKPKTGKSLSDSFYELSTANLSKEVMPFGEKIQEMGQFTSGALPSLFGGAQANSSRTAAQYSMSRAQALQRLQTPWKMITLWWKNIFAKVIPAYIKNMLEDEKLVTKQANGSFLNSWIRKSQLDGKLGSIELEASEQLPANWGAIKDVVMTLLSSQNPEILQTIGSPENLPVLREALGLTDFVIPGEDSRTKQFDEINILLGSQPIPQPDGSESS